VPVPAPTGESTVESNDPVISEDDILGIDDDELDEVKKRANELLEESK